MFVTRKVRRLLSLSPSEWRLYGEAWVLLWQFRLMLWVLPFRRWRRISRSMARVRTSEEMTQPVPSEQLMRALRVMHHYVPDASCLTQALAAQALLARNGQPSTLKIGVARDSGMMLTAHAWVQIGERVVIGQQPELPSYALLPPFELGNETA